MVPFERVPHPRAPTLPPSCTACPCGFGFRSLAVLYDKQVLPFAGLALAAPRLEPALLGEGRSLLPCGERLAARLL